MSAHYSKFDLNTYRGSPYFQAHVPQDYPLDLVLQKCRAFHKLPPRLRELSALAKVWTCKSSPFPAGIEEIERWYDDEGNELNSNTGKPLTEKQVDDEWVSDPTLDDFEVEDIPLPDGGFADPETWEPEETRSEDGDDDRPTEADLLRDIGSHGREYVARDYGIPIEAIESDEDLARAILDARGKPRPADPLEEEPDDDAALAVDASGHEHKGKGAGGGQFAKGGGSNLDEVISGKRDATLDEHRSLVSQGYTHTGSGYAKPNQPPAPLPFKPKSKPKVRQQKTPLSALVSPSISDKTDYDKKAPRENIVQYPHDKIVEHSTGSDVAAVIHKEGFKTDEAVGGGRKSLGAVYFAAPNVFGTDPYARTGEGDVYEGQKAAKIAVNLKGLRLINLNHETENPEELPDDASAYERFLAKHDNAKKYHSAMVAGDMSVLPEGIDGSISYTANGEIGEVVLSKETANRLLRQQTEDNQDVALALALAPGEHYFNSPPKRGSGWTFVRAGKFGGHIYKRDDASTTAGQESVTSPPAPVAARPEHVERGFAAIRRIAGQNNLASLVKVRDALATEGITERAQQDAVIQQLRKSGRVSASGLEGRHGATAQERDAGIKEGEHLLGYLSVRG